MKKSSLFLCLCFIALTFPAHSAQLFPNNITSATSPQPVISAISKVAVTTANFVIARSATSTPFYVLESGSSLASLTVAGYGALPTAPTVDVFYILNVSGSAKTFSVTVGAGNFSGLVSMDSTANEGTSYSIRDNAQVIIMIDSAGFVRIGVDGGPPSGAPFASVPVNTANFTLTKSATSTQIFSIEPGGSLDTLNLSNWPLPVPLTADVFYIHNGSNAPKAFSVSVYGLVVLNATPTATTTYIIPDSSGVMVTVSYNGFVYLAQFDTASAGYLNPGNTINGVLFNGTAAITIPVLPDSVTSPNIVDGTIQAIDIAAGVIPIVPDILTASKLVGAGSTSDAVDLATAEVAGIAGVLNGGTGVGTIPANGIVLGNGILPVTTLVNTTAGDCVKGTGPTTAPVYGACGQGSVDYVYATLTADQSAAVTTDYSFTSQSGNIVITGANITLLANKTYELEGCLSLGNSGTPYVAYQWVNSTTNVVINTHSQGISVHANYTGVAVDGSDTCTKTVFTPNVDTNVKLRSTGGSTSGLAVESTKSFIRIVQLGTSATTVTQETNYMFAARHASQTTGLTAGLPILFNAVDISKGSAISLDVATGIFTLQGGRDYELEASCGGFVTGTELLCQWRDITNNVKFGNAANVFPSIAGRNTMVVGIISPVTSITVRLEIILNNAVTAINNESIAGNGRFAYAKIIEKSPSGGSGGSAPPPLPEYGEAFPVSGSVTTTGTTAATAVDFITFTLPTAGVWDVTYIIRGRTATISGTGVVAIITDSANVLLVNSETVAVGNGGTGANINGTGTGFIRITTTAANEVWKVRIHALTAIGGIGISDPVGRSSVKFRKIQ